MERKNKSAKMSVVTGVIGVDSHVIGNWLVAHVLEQAGFKVHRLGILVSQEDFIDAAIETGAKAMVITSIYGMGIIDCRGFREKCDEVGLKDILIYIGGNLTVRGKDWSKIEKEYKSMGFNRIYPPNANLQDFIKDLKSDLGLTLKVESVRS